jgi:ATP-dependent Zn protease
MNDEVTNDQETETAPSDAETAYHEAGHAVIGCLYDRPPLSATIVRDGDAAGRTDFDLEIPIFARSYLNDSPQKRAYAEGRIAGELAGSAAHDRFKPGRTPDQGDGCDLYWAKRLISDLVSWEDNKDQYLERARTKAAQLVKDNWQWIDAVAKALLEQKTLSRQEILDLRR